MARLKRAYNTAFAAHSKNILPAQRERPWAMEELCLRLKGKFERHPHPMHVGNALRSLGWVQMRDWTNAGGGRRVWVKRD